MLNFVIIITCISLVFLIVLFTLKIKQQKNLSVIGSIFSRIYLIVVLIFILLGNNKQLELVIATGLVAISDILFLSLEKLFNKINNYLVLEYLNNKYYTILDNSLAGVYIMNLNGEFEFVNKTLCKMFGMEKEELLNHSIYKLISEEDAINFKRNVDYLLHSDETYFCMEIEAFDFCKTKIKLKITGNQTMNGHPTITGSILFV